VASMTDRIGEIGLRLAFCVLDIFGRYNTRFTHSDFGITSWLVLNILGQVKWLV